jgi:hypothetical protein
MTIHTTPRTHAAEFLRREREWLDSYTAAVIEAALIGERILRSRVPVDQGELRRETQAFVNRSGAIGAQSTVAEIVEDTPYAAAQEAGTRPFTPSIAALLAWAKRQAPNLGLADDEVYGFAKAVQRSIMAHGIRAKWHTRDSLPDIRAALMTMLANAINRRRGSR